MPPWKLTNQLGENVHPPQQDLFSLSQLCAFADMAVNTAVNAITNIFFIVDSLLNGLECQLGRELHTPAAVIVAV